MYILQGPYKRHGDPLLVWNYTAVACIAFVGGMAFWFCFRHLDSEEDKWNMLKKTEFIGNNAPNANSDEKGAQFENGV